VLERLHKNLGDKFFVSDLSLFDFQFYYFLKIYKELDKNAWTTYPKFKGYYERFEALPTIAAYLKSDRNKPRHLLPSKVATWAPMI